MSILSSATSLAPLPHLLTPLTLTITNSHHYQADQSQMLHTAMCSYIFWEVWQKAMQLWPFVCAWQRSKLARLGSSAPSSSMGSPTTNYLWTVPHSCPLLVYELLLQLFLCIDSYYFFPLFPLIICLTLIHSVARFNFVIYHQFIQFSFLFGNYLRFFPVSKCKFAPLRSHASFFYLPWQIVGYAGIKQFYFCSYQKRMLGRLY